MGAVYLEYEVIGKSKIDASFVEKHKDACKIYGINGYSGSWAEKEEVVIKPLSFGNKEEASDWIYDNNDKMGPAFAVRFVKDDDSFAWLVGGICSL